MKKRCLIEKYFNDNFNSNIKKISNKPYFIKVKEDNNYLIIRYDENKGCNFNFPTVQKCRSIILRHNYDSNIFDGNSNKDLLPSINKKIKFKMIALPYDKFFNYTEHNAKDIIKKMKNKKLYGYEKVDGSLIIMFYDNNKWNIATSGNSNAYHSRLLENDKFKTYGDLFEYCFNNQNGNYNLLDKNKTYMFELISPYNRVVVDYNKPEIYHIGTRNRITFKEDFNYIGIQQPKCIEFNNINEAIKYVGTLTSNDKNYEGLVLRDDDFNRIKVKTDLWFKISNLNNNGVLTEQRIISMIEKGDYIEFLNYFPSYTERFNIWLNRINNLYENLKKEISQIDFSKSQKEIYEDSKKEISNIILKAYREKNKNVTNEWLEKQLSHLTKNKYFEILKMFD